MAIPAFLSVAFASIQLVATIIFVAFYKLMQTISWKIQGQQLLELRSISWMIQVKSPFQELENPSLGPC
jgi:hypothetical protein